MYYNKRLASIDAGLFFAQIKMINTAFDRPENEACCAFLPVFHIYNFI